MGIGLSPGWSRLACGAAFLALLLSGCGEDDKSAPPSPPPPPATFTVGGAITGLSGSVTLLNNGGDARILTANGNFTFATPIAAGSAYAVTIQSQPPNQSCVLGNAAGSSVAANVTAVSVSCETVRATATIGAAGGTLSGPDGVNVEFPPGALTQDTVVGVARAITGAPPPPTANLQAARVYEFTPHDTVFALPVTIRMPVPAGAETPVVLMSGTDAGWMEVGATVENGVATVSRNTFSWGGVYVCAFLPGDPDLDPGGCVNPRGTLALSATPASGLSTVDGLATPRRHRMTAAGTVQMAFAYHVPVSCGNGIVRMRRGRIETNGLVTQPLETLVEQLAPMVANNVAPPGRAADGTVTFNVPVSDAQDGRWIYQTQLLCTHRTGPRVYSLSVILEVAVETAPPPPPPVTFSVGGTVTGLTGSGLVLQNNGGDDLAVSADGAFTFASAVAAGASYVVGVRTQPTNPAQFCSVQNGSGSASQDVTHIVVSCSTVTAKSWRTPQVIDTHGAGLAEAPQTAFDGAGNATVVWTFVTRDAITGNPTSEVWSRRYSPPTGWGTPARLTQVVDGGVEDLRLAVLTSGEAVATWVQQTGWDADLYSSRYVMGTGWAPAVLVEQNAGEAKSLRVAFSSGTAFAVWLQETGPAETEDVWASRYVAGTGWSTPVLIEQRDDGAGDPVIAASADGSAIAVWGQSDNDSAMRMNRYVPGAGWAGDSTITAATDYPDDELAVAMDDAGRAVVAYTRDGFSGGVFGMRYANGSWSTPEPLRASPLFYPARLTIAMKGSGEAVVLWAEGEGLSNMWAKPFGVLTGNAERVGDDLVGGLRPTVAFDPDGTALAAWNYGGAVRASRYSPGAAMPWSTPDVVAPDVSATDVRIAIDAAGNAIAVWQENVSANQSDIGANLLR